MTENTIKQEKRKQFPGNKNYESIIVMKSENVGDTKDTYNDIRIFNSDDENNLFPTKKGITISARTLKQMALFLLNDLLGVHGRGLAKRSLY